jgi:hypothetical protein
MMQYRGTGTKFSTAVRVVLSITFIPPLAAARQQPTSVYAKLIMKIPKNTSMLVTLTTNKNKNCLARG